MLPSLYISHGSPMLALEPGASGPALKRLAAELPRPKAIALVSAHWESTDLRVEQLGHLALDDVGSGDAGLGILGRLRPEYVKVDRSVVCSARDGGSGRAVLAAIVAYAAETGAVVIAEGIETEEILHHLVRAAKTVNRRARFVGGQGFLLGRPAADPWRLDPDRAWPLPSPVSRSTRSSGVNAARTTRARPGLRDTRSARH